jgi:hypothetical protein
MLTPSAEEVSQRQTTDIGALQNAMCLHGARHITTDVQIARCKMQALVLQKLTV